MSSLSPEFPEFVSGILNPLRYWRQRLVFDKVEYENRFFLVLSELLWSKAVSDIFLSYDRTDRETARKFADALEAFGWSIWWDREIPLGKSFDQVIEEELNAARCVVVLWSKASAQSRWVKTEAATAADRGSLVPVLIEDVVIPLEFRRIQAAELRAWDGATENPEFTRLVQAVRQLLGQPEPAHRIAQHTSEEKSATRTWWRTKPALLGAIAALVIIILGLIAGRNTLQKAWQPVLDKSNDTTQGDLPSSPTHTTAVAPSSPPVSGTVKTAPPKSAFSIKIGDKIDDGVPAPGAGSIETPYAQDDYVFTAAPGERVYFRMRRHSTGMSSIKWKLMDEHGTEVFNTCLGCTETGVQILTAGGTYTLTVGSDKDPSTGTYQLQLFNVSPPTQFSIKIGDGIRENMPGPGAGVIESPGSEDIYAFTATPRQRVYFRMWEYSTGMGYIHSRLVDKNGMEVFMACLGCTEPGVQNLITGGTYTLTVGNKGDPSTGTYRLQLFDVPPPNQFSIKIGDKIKAGVPGPGAGVIESPGAEDVYALTASSGQKVYFLLLDRSKGMDYNKWRLVDENGMDVFNACFGCTGPGMQTLTKGGTYTLTVGTRSESSTGNYSFEIGTR